MLPAAGRPELRAGFLHSAAGQSASKAMELSAQTWPCIGRMVGEEIEMTPVRQSGLSMRLTRDKRNSKCFSVALAILRPMPRVVSFLPAATEIVHALGAGPELVGRSHECDYPPTVVTLPVVSKPAIDMNGSSPGAIDEAVAKRMAAGDSMYLIDESLLRSLGPDVILTQNLCRVCAPSGDELTRAVRKFPHQPEVLFLTPRSIEEIVDNIRAVGAAINRSSSVDELIRDITERIRRVRSLTRHVQPRKIVFLE